MASFKRKRPELADPIESEGESDEESDDEDVPLDGELDSDNGMNPTCCIWTSFVILGIIEPDIRHSNVSTRI